MWDFWGTNWYLGKIFSEILGFPYQTSVLHTQFKKPPTLCNLNNWDFHYIRHLCLYDSLHDVSICTRLRGVTYSRLILLFIILSTLNITIASESSWSVFGRVSNIKKALSRSFFSRTIAYDYVEDAEVQGIKGYRFELGKRLVDNGTIDARNQCNCGGQCVPQGALNVTACRHGAPAFVSYPHYLYADPYYIRSVRGMKPDPSHHRFYIILEPVSGHSVGQPCSYYVVSRKWQ
jgi:hypothetical protein